MAVVLEPVGSGDDRLYGVILNENEMHYLRMCLGATNTSCTMKHVPELWNAIFQVIPECKFAGLSDPIHIKLYEKA